jgi:hypothetical protein
MIPLTACVFELVCVSSRPNAAVQKFLLEANKAANIAATARAAAERKAMGLAGPAPAAAATSAASVASSSAAAAAAGLRPPSVSGVRGLCMFQSCGGKSTISILDVAAAVSECSS